MDELARIAKAVSDSGMIRDASTAAAAGTKMIVAQQLGFSPVAGLLGIDVIEGRPRLSARMLLAAVRRHPLYDYRVPYAPTEKKAAVQILHRADTGAEWERLPTITFTIADAERAGLAEKPTFVKYPQAMLYWRAARQAVDFFAPEVSLEWGAPPGWEEVGIDAAGEVELSPPPPQRAAEGEEAPQEEGEIVELPADLAEAAEAASMLEPVDVGDAPLEPLSDGQRRALMAACRDAGVEESERKRLMAFYAQGRSDSTKAYPPEAYRALMDLLKEGPVPAVVWEAVHAFEVRQGGGPEAA
jgi:hypothetical protein